MSTVVELRLLQLEYRKAISAVLKNQSYTIAETTYTKARLADLQKGFDDISSQLKRVGEGGMRVRRIVPRED